MRYLSVLNSTTLLITAILTVVLILVVSIRRSVARVRLRLWSAYVYARINWSVWKGSCVWSISGCRVSFIVVLADRLMTGLSPENLSF